MNMIPVEIQHKTDIDRPLGDQIINICKYSGD